MEEAQIRKILKNLDTNPNKQISSSENNKEYTALFDCDVCDFDCQFSDIDLVQENKRLKEELKLHQLITHMLSEMYLNKNHFLCDIGDDDIPNSIVDCNGEVLLVIPNKSSNSILLSLYLCSFLNNTYNNIEDDIMNDFLSIQGLLLEMGV